MLIHELLTTSAQRYPGKCAVSHQDARLTYAELDLLSDILALKLLRMGIAKGDRVALFMENSCEYVISYFAIQKAGTVVVALNALMVPREVIYLLNDCSPKVLLADKSHAKHFDELTKGTATPIQCQVIEKGTLVSETSQDDIASMLPVKASETDCAAIIYTSGTTGKPKGVMLSHANITANAESIVQYLHLSSDDSVMVILPFYYSYGGSLLTTHIMVGGTLVIDNRFMYPNTVLDAMEKEGVTGFAGVPSHFAILLRKSALKTFALPKLRYVTQAGGAMSPSMIAEFLEIRPNTRFYVMYGQTEASARLSYLEPDVLRTKMGSIGKAIPGVQLDVIAENGSPAKPGEIGEIVAGGQNIMMGYWNSPAETATVLKDGKLYTGDLAKTDEEGYLYIVSRKKDMIKSGANRISPREIEDIVCQLPGILECAAVGLPDEILGEAIILFTVLAEGSNLSEQDIQLFCKQNIAAYKVPKQVKVVPSLPKTASGKVKREDLKKLFGDGNANSITVPKPVS